jgi:hypothetical protein
LALRDELSRPFTEKGFYKRRARLLFATAGQLGVALSRGEALPIAGDKGLAFLRKLVRLAIVRRIASARTEDAKERRCYGSKC